MVGVKDDESNTETTGGGSSTIPTPGATNSSTGSNGKDDGITGSTTNPNLLDRVKGFYQQADTMAMTQALLLNKQLEDQGILPKITDETGLKVIPGSASRTPSFVTTTSTTTNDGSNTTALDSNIQRE
jgi:hypothetical protein